MRERPQYNASGDWNQGAVPVTALLGNEHDGRDTLRI